MFVSILGLVLIILSVAFGLYARKRKYPMLLVFMLFFFMYMSVRPLLLMNDLYVNYAYVNAEFKSYSINALWAALLFQFFTLLSFLIGYFVKFNAQFFSFKQENCLKTNANLILIVFLPLVVGINFIFPYHFSYALMLFLLCYFLLSNFKNKNGVRLFSVYLVIVFSIIFLLSFSEDRRDWLGFLLIFFLIYSLNSKVNLFKTTVFGLSLFIIIVYISVSLRTSGIGDFNSVFERLNNTLIWGVLETETDFSIVYDDFLLFFNHDLPFEFLYGESFLKPFLSVIPREMYPDKIESTSSLFSKMFNPDFYRIGGSEPTTLWGEVYWNFGYVGVLFFTILGFILKRIDNFYINSEGKSIVNQALVVCLAATSFHILRGPADTFWLIHFFILLSAVFFLTVDCLFKKLVKSA